MCHHAQQKSKIKDQSPSKKMLGTPVPQIEVLTAMLVWIDHGVYTEHIRVLLKIMFHLLHDGCRSWAPGRHQYVTSAKYPRHPAPKPFKAEAAPAPPIYLHEGPCVLVRLLDGICHADVPQ